MRLRQVILSSRGISKNTVAIAFCLRGRIFIDLNLKISVHCSLDCMFMLGGIMTHGTD